MSDAHNPAHRLLPALLLLLGAPQASAEDASATLREVAGTVLANQGKVYQPAQSGMQLPLNARILTKDGASAMVVSKQGCPTRLGPNTLFVITQPDPCHGGLPPQKIDPGANLGAGNANGASGATGGGLSTNETVILGAGTVALMTGGIVGGLGASGGLDASDAAANNNAAQAASAAVIAAGGDAKAAYAAALVAGNGGSPQDVASAVLAAGGSPQAAYAAGRAAGGIVGGTAPCVSPTSPDCSG
jgi:hypothetical protein